MQGSIRFGRIAGIPVLVHWSLVVIGVLLSLNLAHAVAPRDGLSAGSVTAAVAAAVAFFGSVLAHELAHALTARRYGVATESITLWGLGGLAQLSDEPPTAKAQGWIALAGPVASAVLGGIGLGGALWLDSRGVSGEAVTMVGWLGVINLLLAAFNLLPGAPLDGGRLVTAWRWGRHGDRYLAMAEAANAGRFIGWAIAGIGVYLMVNGAGGVFVIVTGVFIALNASAERQGAQARQRLAGLLVADLTFYGIAHAPRDTDAETMLWQRRRLGLPGVVAVDDPTGATVGLVAEEQLWRVPELRRPDTELGELAVPLQQIAKARPDEQLTSALARLRPALPLLTVWSDDRLVGVVTEEAVRQHLVFAEG
jgi:Zn-dependent protease